jgi:RNA polymerase sigma factor (sigma-70 family)
MRKRTHAAPRSHIDTASNDDDDREPPASRVGDRRPPTPSGDLLAELREQSLRGNTAAQTELLRILRPRLLRVARAVLRSSIDAEDCVQDALLAVIHALPAFRGDSTVMHFASSIASRCARAHARRVHAEGELAARSGELDPQFRNETSTPSEDSVRARRRAALRALVSELPESQAQTVLLRVLLDYSVQETAASAGVPVNTVRSRLRLARDALRSRIERDPILSELFDTSGDSNEASGLR